MKISVPPVVSEILELKIQDPVVIESVSKPFTLSDGSPSAPAPNFMMAEMVAASLKSVVVCNLERYN